MSPVRGIRGANTVEDNTRAAIFQATRELLETVVRDNELQLEDIVSVFLTLTPDLDADFPATAARDMGWDRVPLLCATEINVPGAMPRCLRVLMHVHTGRSQNEIKHVYLGRTAALRPDLSQ
ncbi:MAG: chorismate mutase [Bacillota bacterium]